MTNFQRASGEQGKAFEEIVKSVLSASDVDIIEHAWKDPATSEEVDFVVKTRSGVTVWVEAKGSWQGKTKGIQRSDTSKKAVANAWHFTYVHGEQRPPYVLVSSHLPKAGTVAEKEIEHALEAGLFTAVVLLDDLKATIAAIDAGRLT
jgi:Holliday junction resolvase-like predicted endonuclease